MGKKKISKRQRRNIWEKWGGQAIGKGNKIVYTSKCSVSWCNNILNALDSWHAGHVIAESKGGETVMANLRPICAQCNLCMGTTSITEFSNLDNPVPADYTVTPTTKIHHPKELEAAKILTSFKVKSENCVAGRTRGAEQLKDFIQS